MSYSEKDEYISETSISSLSGALRRRLFKKNSLSGDTPNKDRSFEQYKGISYLSESQDKEMVRQFYERWNVPIRSDDNLSLEKFCLIRTLGEGSFGRVILAKTMKIPSEKVALKMLSKKRMLGKHQAQHTVNEKRLMWACMHPHIIPLVFCFKDNSNLYLGIEYAPGGDLFYQLRKSRRFSEWISKFFAAQVCFR
ncbi:hypothetical protein GJ496_006447 [Pomphorhynchus laevis]|nr:hypothetical protein GJ496_006447 [Pomphorhynchus laevis]